MEVFESTKELRPLGVGINLLPHAVRELDALGLLDELTCPVGRSVASPLLHQTGPGDLARAPGDRRRLPLAPVVRSPGRAAGRHAARAGRSRWGRRRCTSDGGSSGSTSTAERPAAIFEDGRVVQTSWWRPTGSTASAVRSTIADEGPLQWNGSLLWRGVAETEAVLDGRTMVWAGHPEQKFVGYPIADLPGRQAGVQLRGRAPTTGLGPGLRRRTGTAGVRSATSSRRCGVGLRMARRAVHRPGCAGDVPLPDGRSRSAPPLDIRAQHPSGRRRAPDVPDRIQRRVPGHPRRPGARRMSPATSHGPRRGPGALRAGPSTTPPPPSSTPIVGTAPSSPWCWSRSGRRRASPTSPT